MIWEAYVQENRTDGQTYRRPSEEIFSCQDSFAVVSLDCGSGSAAAAHPV